MTREELIARLELLVREDKLSILEARSIVRRFDNGHFDERELPLTREEEQRQLETVLTVGSIAAYLLSVRRRKPRGIEGRFTVVAHYERTILPLSDIPVRAKPDIREWHQRMRESILSNALAQAEAGLGRVLTPREASQVGDLLGRQDAYLERFADEIAFRRLSGRPMSAKAIFDRSRQYGGFAIGLFFRMQEQRFDGLRGWISEYIPVDDPATCRPCHEAGIQGPYLPTQGPFPGEVCVAKGKCRCRRELHYDLTQWRILTNNLGRGRLISLS